MKWVWYAGAGLAAVIAAVAIIGAMTPRNHHVSSSIVLRQSPDTIWAVMRDFNGVTRWWSSVKTSDRLDDVNGHERWHQRGGGSDMTIEITSETPPSRFTTLIVPVPGAPFGGTWTYDLSPTLGGTRVTVTEDGWVGNVIFRFVSRFVMGHYATIDGYLGALSRRFGERATPVHGA